MRKAGTARVAAVAVAAALAYPGCSPAERYPERPSLIDGQARAPRYQTPAMFRYHPADVGDLHPAATLPGGAELLLGERGERWLVEANGQAQVSSMFAPERLVDAVNLSADSWLFVGQAGGVYEAADPIGPFLRSGMPPRPLARVAVTSEALVGVTLGGDVVRSLDFGETWLDVPTPTRAVDVELLPDGRGLLLGIPEQLHSTADHGKSFEPLPGAPFGAWSLHRLDDRIEIAGALGRRVYDARGNAAKPVAASAKVASTPEVQPPSGPAASRLRTGQAVVSEDEYFELSADKQGFQLHHGRLGSDLSVRRIPALSDCEQVRIAARGSRLLVACAPSDESDVELVLFSSADAGESFTPLPLALRGSIDLVQIAFFDEQRFAITGICPSDETELGCKPRGIHLGRVGDGATPRLTAARTPSLLGPALALVAAPQGGRVHALGRRTKGSALGAFVSTDGGEAWSATEVPELELGPSASVSGLRFLSTEVGTDGTLATVVHEPVSRAQLLLTLDERGRFVALTSAPRPDATLGAAGLLALAVTHPAGEVFESLDGGSEWTSVGRVPTAGCSDGKCAVMCYPAGCVIGESVTRVGWEGQQEAALLAPSSATGGSGMVRSVAATAVCRFEADWLPLRAEFVPNAGSAALAEAAWFTFHSRFQEASFTFHTMPERGTLTTQVLVPPATAPGKTALYYTHQIEGAAVMRQIEGRGVDVAWVNLFESPKARHVHLPESHRVKTRVTRFQTKLAEPTALTIGRGGLFFASDWQRPYFLHGSQVEPLSWQAWPDTIQPGRDELLRAGEQKLLVRFFGNGSAVAWASAQNSVDAPGAQTVGLPYPADFGVSQEMTLAYTGDTPGLYVANFAGARSTAYVMPFDQVPLGAPVPVPTQGSLGSTPVPCTEVKRRNTPRAVTSYEPGTRHAVVISDPNEPMPVLVTGDAVLHGTPADPCAVAFDAETVGVSSDRVQALVFVEPGARSWAFRKTADGEGDDDLEYRAMACAFDPNAEVPEEVFQAPGTER